MKWCHLTTWLKTASILNTQVWLNSNIAQAPWCFLSTIIGGSELIESHEKIGGKIFFAQPTGLTEMCTNLPGGLKLVGEALWMQDTLGDIDACHSHGAGLPQILQRCQDQVQPVMCHMLHIVLAKAKAKKLL